MKMHIAAIGFNEKELDVYISELRSKGFENLSEIKKAEDGSYYVAMGKASKFDLLAMNKATTPVTETVPA